MRKIKLERLSGAFSLGVDEWFKSHCGKPHYANADARMKDLEAMADSKNDSALDECAEWLTSTKRWAPGIAYRMRDKIRERLAVLASAALGRNEACNDEQCNSNGCKEGRNNEACSKRREMHESKNGIDVAVENWFYNNAANRDNYDTRYQWLDHLFALSQGENDIAVERCLNALVDEDGFDEDEVFDYRNEIADILAELADIEYSNAKDSVEYDEDEYDEACRRKLEARVRKLESLVRRRICHK